MTVWILIGTMVWLLAVAAVLLLNWACSTVGRRADAAEADGRDELGGRR